MSIRWELTKRAWGMAKDKFPAADRLYVVVPDRLAHHGSCGIFDLDRPDQPLCSVSYGIRLSDSGGATVSVSLGDRTEALPLPNCLAMSRIPQKIARNNTCAEDLAPLVARCEDGFELGQKLAILATAGGKSFSRPEAEEWLSCHSIPRNIVTPFVCALGDMKALKEGKFSAYNQKVANKMTFKPYQRVRVISPASMEYQECGRVLEHRGGGRDPAWYLVLVDGSERPIWFPEEGLAPDEAGQVVFPDEDQE